jgi:hypothetical protein
MHCLRLFSGLPVGFLFFPRLLSAGARADTLYESLTQGLAYRVVHQFSGQVGCPTYARWPALARTTPRDALAGSGRHG